MRGPINATLGVTWSASYNAILHLTDDTIPKNSGCFRPVRVVAPRATVVNVDYPDLEQEYRIIRMTTAPREYVPEKIFSRADILELTEIVARLEAPKKTVAYATRLARLTRPDEPEAPESVKKYIAWGVGPRGAQGLVLAAKVRAILQGRKAATIHDIQVLAPHVFRHRMIMNFQATAEDLKGEDVLADVFEAANPTRSPAAT